MSTSSEKLSGLTSQQAQEQSQQGNGNVQTLSDTKTVGQIVRKNLALAFKTSYFSEQAKNDNKNVAPDCFFTVRCRI